MISAPLRALLDAIGKHEAPKGYGQIYGGAKGIKPGLDVSKMSLGGVLALQQRMKAAGSASTACGRYQFINKTLIATIGQLALPLDRIWTPDLQDRMAIHLMQGRGLDKYMAGRMSAEDFANNLSMEWASLPVVKSNDNVGSSFYRKRVGASYYAGDGLNKSFHKPADILKLLYNLKYLGGHGPSASPAPVPYDPPMPALRKRGLLSALIDLILTIFGRRK